MVLIFLALMNVDYLWNGNHTDDGYYLSKIRMAPYVSSYVDYNYATGFTAPGSIVRNLNTFEIEAAFYCQILGMEATIYAKVFLSAIHYMILYNVIALGAVFSEFTACTCVFIFCWFADWLGN